MSDAWTLTRPDRELQSVFPSARIAIIFIYRKRSFMICIFIEYVYSRT